VSARFLVRKFHAGSILVDVPIKVPNQTCNADFESLTDTQEGCDCDRATSLDLLPVAGGEAKGDHVLLAEASLLTKFADALTQFSKELLLIRHPTRL
jgi:hypothetical protein